MSKYIFKSLKDPDNEFSISEVTFEIDTDRKSELVVEFVNFLRACGYSTKDLEENLDI